MLAAHCNCCEGLEVHQAAREEGNEQGMPSFTLSHQTRRVLLGLSAVQYMFTQAITSNANLGSFVGSMRFTLSSFFRLTLSGDVLH